MTAFWDAFRQTQAVDPASRFYEAFHFGDNEALANALATLVLAGRKRATAGLLWTFEHEGRRPPAPGDLSVVTDWHGKPLCVIETRVVNLRPFDAVTAEFAALEGEGDGSLQSWRAGHWEYFGRQCRRIGRTPDGQMPVVCEEFAVVSSPEAPRA